VFQSVWVNAFIIGMISACSMPLGSLTSLVWSPKNRALAFLVAFGGGALLAALVIDLVGSATEKGHFLELVVGSILGSLFFTLVNKLVNDSGGFLRKPSTILNYFTAQEEHRLKDRLSRLKQMQLFRDMSSPLLLQIAKILLTVEYPKGTTLYRPNDPSESLYLLKKGKVDLLDPPTNSTPLMSLNANDSFDQGAFLTGCPLQSLATATQDCELEILPRAAFEQLLETSPELLEITAQALQQKEIKDYLQQRHGFSLSQVQEWVGLAIDILRRERKIHPAINLTQNQEDFLHLARQIKRFPIFSYLPQADLIAIADRLVYNRYPNGYVFFQPQDLGDRLYILHQGEVQIVYPSHLQKAPLLLTSGDPLGELSFVTGASHTVTAIATTEVGVWTIRKQDFEALLQQSSDLAQNTKTFLEEPKLQEYLQTRQNLESTQALEWIQQALASMNGGKLIPSATVMFSHNKEHNNAPLSIWLGLLMDSIPEALTIGAHLASAPISPSLLAGVLIANYPEALSSSVGMKKQGFSIPKILVMWTSIMIITGLLSALGSVIFANAPEALISFLESMAAGAMLTVIAETMLPEAYVKGSSIVGISTLLGFLVIVIIGSLDVK
jgi:CRP-like cAMP-binding protein